MKAVVYSFPPDTAAATVEEAKKAVIADVSVFPALLRTALANISFGRAARSPMTSLSERKMRSHHLL
jgi:hypothetical protein